MSVPPPPVNDVVFMATERAADIVQLVPGAISCGGVAVSALRLERPFITSTGRFGPRSEIEQPRRTLDFAIDADGRPINIRPGTIRDSGFFIDTSDLAPSLAASRFRSGAPKADCRVEYRANLSPVTTAPSALLYEAASAPLPGGAQNDIYSRLNALGDCARGPGSPRRLNYPDFEAIMQAPGTRSWSFLTFDVDASGRTHKVHVVGSSGNRALDVASVKALGANRYAAGKVSHRCTFHFFRTGNTPVEAPPIPFDSPKDSGELAACAINPKSMSALLNGTAYPAAFAARRIEGYAIIGFDTAPWGGIGNVKVLASEPDQAFGLAALQGIMNAKVAERDVGYRGCVRRVLFRLPREKPAG